MAITDRRVSAMNEVIEAMKVIKMYAWEHYFLERILKIRKEELNHLSTAYFLSSFTSTISPCIPLFAFCGTFFTLIFLGIEMSSGEILTMVSLFMNLQDSINSLPLCLKSITEARIAFHRLQCLLEQSEYQQVENTLDDAPLCLKLSNCSFGWDSNEPPTLRNISLSVDHQGLFGIS